MRVWMTMSLVLAACGAAAAQDEGERKMEEMSKDQGRDMEGMEKKFHEEREKRTQEFRRRMEEFKAQRQKRVEERERHEPMERKGPPPPQGMHKPEPGRPFNKEHEGPGGNLE